MAAKLVVEIAINGDAKDLMAEMEKNRKEWFIGTTNIIRIPKVYLKEDPDGEAYLFRLKGVIDDESGQ